MGLRMPGPYRHPDSGIFWMRQRVPTDLVKIAGRQEVKCSLRTRDPVVAKSAYLEAMRKLDARWRALRLGVKTISHKEAVAIAGEFYRALVAEHEENPGDRDVALARLLSDQVAAGDRTIEVIRAGDPDTTQRLLDRITGQNRGAVEDYLRTRGERIDDESFERVLDAVNKAMAQGREQILRFVDQDYRADPNAERFPKRAAPSVAHDGAKGSRHYLLVDIYERYATETEQAPTTRKKWRAIIALVAKVHPDIRTITPDWCITWKDALKEQGLTPRSIQYGYLAALRSTCEWGKKNRRIDVNPVDGIGLAVKKTPKGLRRRGYDDDEAKFVLALTLRPVEERLSVPHKNARRWIPWICCYTGARVGEIAQLRKEDVKVKNGIPLIWITPEAGTIKDGNPRYVAVHPHLIEEGFLAFVGGCKAGPLFFDPKLARGGTNANPQSKKVGERICAWIRANGITDKRLAPNHAWRHRFKTQCRANKVDPGARDYMQGHVPHNDAEDYGEFPPEALRSEIEKLPRVELAP